MQQSHLRFVPVTLFGTAALVAYRRDPWPNPTKKKSRRDKFWDLGGQGIGPHILSNFQAAAHSETLSWPNENVVELHPAEQ
jgi:hypothetical protein